MAALAAFVQSPQGRFYADVCERYGVDPGAAFDDDVMAFNARAAFAVDAARRAEAQADQGSDDVLAKTREMERLISGR